MIPTIFTPSNRSLTHRLRMRKLDFLKRLLSFFFTIYTTSVVFSIMIGTAMASVKSSYRNVLYQLGGGRRPPIFGLKIQQWLTHSYFHSLMQFFHSLGVFLAEGLRMHIPLTWFLSTSYSFRFKQIFLVLTNEIFVSKQRNLLRNYIFYSTIQIQIPPRAESVWDL